ncbi:hypothetical protein [Streptomyces broussonetiae]|uniref:Acyl-CoA carboxylase subunit epsilon n=1 Tax=Streptomyces broussonetiae TaxID=2686304 RepID=A0ABV5EDE9_9ACTN
MADRGVTERIAVRPAEWDDPEEQLVKQLAEVGAERDDLAAAGRVLRGWASGPQRDGPRRRLPRRWADRGVG